MFGCGSAVFGAAERLLRQPEAGAGAAHQAGALQNGLMTGTRLATNLEWRPVEAIAVGDGVLTFYHGPEKVVAISRDRLAARTQPISIPPGVKGNTAPLTLLPDAPVMIEADIAEELFGCPFALVAASTLVGDRGIEQVHAAKEAEMVTLHCAHDEVLYAEGGALLLATAQVPGLVSITTLDEMPDQSGYKLLDKMLARQLVAHLSAADALRAQKQAGRAPLHDGAFYRAA
ncbi:MAG TPA: hypothetical protein ENK83_04025 [Aliiroseovarius sp.]|nr:hypothetical protein [Aliiroseovarius sp.]